MFKQIRLYFLKRRIARAVKKAEKNFRETRYHYLVLKIGKKIVVRSRKVLKEQIAAGMWKKGVTIYDLEKKALYKTY
jgi:hypothetical protein